MDRVTVYAPGSVSNLGPGFDCLGLAITGKGDRVTARHADAQGVSVAAVSEPNIPKAPDRNTAAIAASAVLRRIDAKVGIELVIEKGLRLASGLGGSAASAVAGAVATDALLNAGLPPADLMEAALEAEAFVSGLHYDNVMASLLGGGRLLVSAKPTRIASVRVHPSLLLVLVTPAYEVETAKARAVLPSDVKREHAVTQAARLGGLLLGLERGDAELLRVAMNDVIAEPARVSLYPGYANAKAAALEAGAYGVSVSGAGPTVMALTTGNEVAAVTRALEEAYLREEIHVTSFTAGVDETGARRLA